MGHPNSSHYFRILFFLFLEGTVDPVSFKFVSDLVWITQKREPEEPRTALQVTPSITMARDLQ
jgi:hypothetical protein